MTVALAQPGIAAPSGVLVIVGMHARTIHTRAPRGQTLGEGGPESST